MLANFPAGLRFFRDKQSTEEAPMNQDPTLEIDEKAQNLTLTVEETVEELEERIAPRLSANHNETLVIDSAD
jgi:hypothetical protein